MTPAVPLPKYHQVYLVLREHLAEGRFRDGVPPELRLVQQFGVARATVRKALERLAAEGLIDRRPGRGTRPRRHETSAASTAPANGGLGGLLENIVHMGLQTRVKVLSCHVIAAVPAVAQRLALPARARVQKAARFDEMREAFLLHVTSDGEDAARREAGLPLRKAAQGNAIEDALHLPLRARVLLLHPLLCEVRLRDD